jgi:hypothetical protein
MSHVPSAKAKGKSVQGSNEGEQLRDCHLERDREDFDRSQARLLLSTLQMEMKTRPSPVWTAKSICVQPRSVRLSVAELEEERGALTALF